MSRQLPPSHALIVVDVQNDFVTGSLAMRKGEEVVPVVNRLCEAFETVVFTKDWHPADHGSFAVNHPGKALFELVDLNGLTQTLWPAHCVQGDPGAELVEGVRADGAHVILKGTDPAVDSYSGFFDNDQRKATGLEALLKGKGITDVFVCGLATDYCVKATAVDAARLGFQTYLVEDASRGVDLNAGDVAGAIREMQDAGVCVLNSGDVAGAPQG